MKGLNMSMESYTVGKGFTSSTITQIPMRAITFQVSWTFGKQGNYSAKKTRRSIENEGQLNSLAGLCEVVGAFVLCPVFIFV
jgi:hypothetical protein